MQIDIINIQTVKGIDSQPYCRHADITISDAGTMYAWRVGGIPFDVDAQIYLDNMANDIWRDAEARGEAPQTEITYVLPIRTHALYADDVFVSSRDIKDDPLEALAEALTETKKGKGKPKSLDMIARSTLKALEHAIKEIDKLRLEVDQLKKKVK